MEEYTLKMGVMTRTWANMYGFGGSQLFKEEE